MSRKFESADPLRRGSRRPHAAALRAAAERAAQARRTVQTPHPFLAPPPSVASDVSRLTSDGPVEEFSLKMGSAAEIDAARFHILKFHSPNLVDPAQDFVPPIRMHRKDPKQLQIVAEEGDSMDVDTDQVSQANTSGEFATRNGHSPAFSGSNAAPPPPTSESASLPPDGERKRPFNRRRKTHQVYGGEKHEAARKLRYEEHYPWVMEDFDNQHAWISSYDAAQSSNLAILTYDSATNGFSLLPIEKVYKMTAATRYATLTLEDAEKKMESKNLSRVRWMMSHLQPKAGSPDFGGEMPPSAPLTSSSRLRTVVGSEERKHKYNLDEAMDFDDQELFDDDEGAPILDGPEEDLKEAENRIKEEQLKANELMENGDVDELFEDAELKEGRQGRKVRKALRALEKNQYYDTDDENNPYASSSSNDSDDELVAGMVKQEIDDASAGNGMGAGAPSGLLPAGSGGANLVGAGNNANTATTNSSSTNSNNINPNAANSSHDAAQAAAEAAASSLLVSQFRRRAVNRDALPRGTAVLQLDPSLLKRFVSGEWNPNAKRTQHDDVSDWDDMVLTRDDVRKHIKSGETDLKQLLAALRPKIAGNDANRALLKQYIKEVARHRDGKLILRS